MVIHAENGDWSLSEEIAMLSFFKPDVILIEGYKNESYPKAVILRDESDLEMVEKLKNIQVVLCRKAELVNMLKGSSIPVFEIEEGVNWILEYIRTQ
ncbi:molybdopterin-guanine dinucleotide biosynthesis protein MobB [Mesobacillus subterraneus]|uniref:molybdopterin-guanine dinucleotide biosynthesis protein MobB n=1 Tax=Mesobacillus subterraneus TaxID=285983 RepID=UPI00273D8133|nr:molybdopterin-guanine dinucleotide biosynthesis protein MobB [Mesobacillus subterraneus]WLR53866.1 molybdopterin-guanine dinucleotide biosynthesis protein MobB [Mesobacillus subterraneus]